jgi:transposase
MPEAVLFETGPTLEHAPSAADGGVPRVQVPVRNQVEIVASDLDSLIPDEHQVRAVWEFAEKADLSELYAQIKAVEGGAGRTPIDPRILFALWLYATLRAIGSARELDRLCTAHVEYRWLCGGVSVNYHTLADFRSESGPVLDQVLSDSVAHLQAEGLVPMVRAAHDGVRVRANAGSGSFRRKDTLERLQQEAEEQVQTLKRELHDDPGASSARQKAARTRAAAERLARVQAALQQYADVQAKKKHDKDQARVSVTDPDARKMHMPDGGTRPAYNVQLSADTGSQIIVGASVIQSGSDHAQLVPAVETMQAQQGAAPKEILADGGFAKPADIEKLAQAPYNCTVYAPPTQFKDKDGKPLEPQQTEGPDIKEWRARMQTAQAQAIYRERAATIECVNALARNRGLQQFRVRGLRKVYAVVLLFVLAHNLMRAESLKRERLQQAGVPVNTG